MASGRSAFTGGSHALDGHPGFDVEFRPGAFVLGAADGTIQNVLSDSNTEGRFSIRIDQAIWQLHNATDYTNVRVVTPGVVLGATVARGDSLGTAGTQTQFIGPRQIT